MDRLKSRPFDLDPTTIDRLNLPRFMWQCDKFLSNIGVKLFYTDSAFHLNLLNFVVLCMQPGILVPEALGLGNWVKAQEWAALPGGQATYLGNPVPWGTLPTILVIEFLSIAFVEHQRSMEKDPEKKKYPGGAFDPLGYSKDPKKFHEYKIKEVKNGKQELFVTLYNT